MASSSEKPDPDNKTSDAPLHPEPSPSAPAHYSAGHQPPLAMVYPPAMPYPPCPAPYNNNNYGGPYSNYPVAQQPEYPNAYMLQPMTPDRRSGSACKTLGRGFLIVIIALIIFTFISNLVDFFATRSIKNPVFRVAAFSVTNFSIANSILTGNWQARVILENPDDQVKILLDRLESAVYHKQSTDILGWNAQPPLSLDQKAIATLIIESRMANTGQPENSVLDDIDKEIRQDGLVDFGLMMKGMLAYQLDGPLSVLHELRVICEDLKLGFPGGAMNGTTIFGNPKECSMLT